MPTHAKIVRKEGKYHLYRCLVCLRAKYGDCPTPEEIKATSFTNVIRHHDRMHPGVPFVATRGDVYVQPANAQPKLLKAFQSKPFKIWPRTESAPKEAPSPLEPLPPEPLMHLSEYYPPAPFYVEPNPCPIY